MTPRHDWRGSQTRQWCVSVGCLWRRETVRQDGPWVYKNSAKRIEVSEEPLCGNMGGRMKTRVVVRLVAECEVEIDVTYKEGEEPTDLTPEEERKAIMLADQRPRWYVDRVREIK